MLLRTLSVALLLAVSACQSRGREPRVSDPLEVRAGIEAMAPFLGHWEGVSQTVDGDLRLVRRLSWLVRGSWILEQTLLERPEDGRELNRGGALYTYDADARRIRAVLLGPAGQERSVWFEWLEDGRSWMTTPDLDEPPRQLFQTTHFTGREWGGRTLVLNEDDEWLETSRFSLKRRHLNQNDSP